MKAPAIMTRTPYVMMVVVYSPAAQTQPHATMILMQVVMIRIAFIPAAHTT
jgi:hypothetical protein